MAIFNQGGVERKNGCSNKFGRKPREKGIDQSDCTTNYRSFLAFVILISISCLKNVKSWRPEILDMKG